jgi:hypothetical protein
MGPYLIKTLQVYQGIDYMQEFVFFGRPDSGSTEVRDLVPFDLTGAALRMRVRLEEDPASTSLLALSSGAGLTLISDTFSPGPAMPAAPNGVRIQITRAQSLAMNGGEVFHGYYDVIADQADGTSMLLLCGAFQLQTTVTR